MNQVPSRQLHILAVDIKEPVDQRAGGVHAVHPLQLEQRHTLVGAGGLHLPGTPAAGRGIEPVEKPHKNSALSQ